MMELKRKNYLAAAVVGGVALGLFCGCAGQSRRAETAARPTAAPSPSGSTTVPAEDELRRAVAAIFAQHATGSAREAQVPLSPAFVADKVRFRRFLDIAGASDVRPRVDDVHGRDVDLTIGYALVSDMKVKMMFARRDTWTFTRGDAGWQLDGIRVNDEALAGLVFPDGSRENVADSRYDPASGSVTFSTGSGRYVWTPNTQWGWKIVALATPRPAPPSIALTTPASSPSPRKPPAPSPSPRRTPAPSPTPRKLVAAPTPSATATQQPRRSPAGKPSGAPAAAHAATATRTPPTTHAQVQARTLHAARETATRPPVAYVPADPYDVCSTETIDSVSEDGSVVTLADGRRYLVRESERYVSSLWIAADDVTLCDPGPGMDAKLTHRGDVVYAGHLQ